MDLAEPDLRFSHNLIGRTIYELISSLRRQAMHRRIAEILEVETALDLKLASDLAHHASLSGDHALAAKAMVQAGRLCLRFFANDDALQLADKGIALAQNLDGVEQVCLLLELHDIKFKAAPVSDWQTAAALMIELAEQALDYGSLTHARLGYKIASQFKWIHGHWGDARLDSMQAERVTRSGDDAEHIEGMAEAARCLILLERDLSRADAMLMEAKSIAQRKRTRPPAVALAEGMMCYYRSEFDAAEEALQEARTQFKSLGDRLNEYHANEYLVMLEIERGCYDAAARRNQQLLGIGEKLPEGSEGPFARALQALCCYVQGACGDELTRAVQALRECDAKHRLSYILVRAAFSDLHKQSFTTALARAEEALQYSALLNRPTERLLAHTVLAHAYRQLGEAQASSQHRAEIESLRKTTQNLAVWAKAISDHWLTRDD